MDTCVHVADSLRCSPETITTLISLCVCVFSFFLYSFILWDFFCFIYFSITALSTGYTPYKIKRLKKKQTSIQSS